MAKLINLPNPVNLTLEREVDGAKKTITIHLPRGEQRVDDDVAEHPYVQAHMSKDKPKAATPGAMAPPGGVVNAGAALTEEEGGEQAGEGAEGNKQDDDDGEAEAGSPGRHKHKQQGGSGRRR